MDNAQARGQGDELSRDDECFRGFDEEGDEFPQGVHEQRVEGGDNSDVQVPGEQFFGHFVDFVEVRWADLFDQGQEEPIGNSKEVNKGKHNAFVLTGGLCRKSFYKLHFHEEVIIPVLLGIINSFCLS